MVLTEYVHTFGQWLKQRYGERVHKIALDVGFTCPNRDGSKGIGGCTFCNNSSFSPIGHRSDTLGAQMDSGRRGIERGTRARRYLAYFQAYTNTYSDVRNLQRLYDEALAYDDVIGLAIGTRPDCVPDEVIDLLCRYRDQGREVWLELGLQSSFDDTLERVNRGHGFKEYIQACKAARQRGIPVCTHLIVGLPGETPWHNAKTLEAVLDVGTDGLKLHPLHVVRGTALANDWRAGRYRPLAIDDYAGIAADLVEMTPWHVLYHRLTGTAPANLLLAPDWCRQKWPVINAVVSELKRRGTRQGARSGQGEPS
ncbi:MAG TPA: TIGR01212 family radical SAM protein [Parasulfuritortus sp.]